MRLRRIILVLAGSAIAFAQPSFAAPVGGSMGATSRAVLHLTVSVRPRVGISTQPGRRAGAPSDGLCIWSSSPSRQFTITLVGSSGEVKAEPAPMAGDPRRPLSLELIAGRPIEIMAEASPFACGSGPRPLVITPAKLGPTQRLLLIAPQ